jgi:hypothetical protein
MGQHATCTAAHLDLSRPVNQRALQALHQVLFSRRRRHVANVLRRNVQHGFALQLVRPLGEIRHVLVQLPRELLADALGPRRSGTSCM